MGMEVVFLHDEPPHVHARKGDSECKYWLHEEQFDIEEEYTYNMSPSDRRQIRKIIFANFNHIITEYKHIHGR